MLLRMFVCCEYAGTDIRCAATNSMARIISVSNALGESFQCLVRVPNQLHSTAVSVPFVPGLQRSGFDCAVPGVRHSPQSNTFPLPLVPGMRLFAFDFAVQGGTNAMRYLVLTYTLAAYACPMRCPVPT
eukprot:3138979-Rhodomonas_salina.2